MRLLLDTHLMIWWQADSPRLPANLVSHVDEADVVFFSRASLWEVAIKVSIGKLKLNVEQFAENVGKHGFEWLDIKNTHLIKTTTLPHFSNHKDPFDRLLIAQSQSESLLFLSVDRKLAQYGEMVKVL